MKSVVIIECSTVRTPALYLFIFRLTVRRIRMIFILNPSASQGESSLKISAHQVQSFGRSQGTNKQTNPLTSFCSRRRICQKILYFSKLKLKMIINASLISKASPKDCNWTYELYFAMFGELQYLAGCAINGTFTFQVVR